MWLYIACTCLLLQARKVFQDFNKIFYEKSRKMPTCVVLGCKNIQFRNCGKSFYRFVKYKNRLIHMRKGKNCLLPGRWFFQGKLLKITLRPGFKATIFQPNPHNYNYNNINITCIQILCVFCLRFAVQFPTTMFMFCILLKVKILAILDLCCALYNENKIKQILAAQYKLFCALFLNLFF